MTKRTTMKAYDAHINPSDAAASLQRVIDGIESKGHYIVQYVPVSQYTGLFLAHDYPDKKAPAANPDKAPTTDPDKSPEGQDAAPEASSESTGGDQPAEAGAPAVTDNLNTREGAPETPATPAPDKKATPGKGKKK